jgi:hypothetical protein
MLQDPWHMLPGMLHDLLLLSVLITWEVMSAKHDQVKKKIRAKGQTEGGKKLLQYSLYWLALTSMGICKVRAESLSKTASSKKQCSPLTSISHSFFMSDLVVANLCDIMGFWDICCSRRGKASKVWECFASISVQVSLFMCSKQHGKKKVYKKVWRLK